MLELTTPGVYIEEQPAVGPIAGVGTSTAAFVGFTVGGPVATPTPVGNLTRFTETFGTVPRGTSPYFNLAAAVRGFFENGGTNAYIVRVGTAAHALLDLPAKARSAAAVRVTAKAEGSAGNAISVGVEAGDDDRFNLVVAVPDGDYERFEGLSMDPDDPRFVGSAVRSAVVDIVVPATPANRELDQAPPADAEPRQLAGGTDDRPGAATAAEWKAAFDALGRVDDVNVVCAPGATSQPVQEIVLSHCGSLRDRFAVLDSVPHAGADTSTTGVLDQRSHLDSKGGYAALYYPWLKVADPGGGRGDTLLVPPSGHIAGVLARVDTERGVHKAPANELIAGVVGLERILTDGDQGTLNTAGINVLRVFAGRSRPVVWGARTTAPAEDTAWRYVNVRRLFLFLEESIQEGIRWAVFEPNGLSLWKRLNRTITEFLTRAWSAGALFGATAADAFYVKIDEENNPAPVRDLGRVVIEVGIAPVRPAEFVVVRIGMWAGGAEIEEG